MGIGDNSGQIYCVWPEIEICGFLKIAVIGHIKAFGLSDMVSNIVSDI